MLNFLLIVFIILFLVLFLLQSHVKSWVFYKEYFSNNSTERGLISQPPNPDVTAQPTQGQPVQGEPAFLASAPGVVPGAAEISQDTTSFITNTPSASTQQFASPLIVTGNQANGAYKDILQYLAQNPTKSTGFLEDLRAKFFENTCKYKENINFKSLAQAENMVFNS